MIATFFVLAISVVPLGLAFKLSPNNTPGSTSDANFWLVLQNSLMQALGLATTIFTSPVIRSGKRNILEWKTLSTWTIAIIGLGFVFSAPLAYTRAPPIYSSIISFFASAAQVLMVLQLVLFLGMGTIDAKMD